MRSPEEDEKVAMAHVTTTDRTRPSAGGEVGHKDVLTKESLRLYFWFKNAPADRPGGPWWHRDFTTETSLKAFLWGMKPHLCAYATSSGDEAVQLDDTRPPSSAWLWVAFDSPPVWKGVEDAERKNWYCD